jgi:hypothetical protein
VPICLDNMRGLTSLDLDPTDLTVTHTETGEGEGSLRIWHKVKGTPLEVRLCVQCQRHYIAAAGLKRSTCGPTCRKKVSDSHRQKKAAEAMASAEEEDATTMRSGESIKVFVCEICPHECKTQFALDNHIRVAHKE